MMVRRRVEWAIEVASLAACATLVNEGRVTVHGTEFSAIVLIAVAILVGSDAACLAARTAASRLAPLCLAVLLPGLLVSDSARVTVWALAGAALLPLAVIYAMDSRMAPRIVDVLLVGAALATALARILFREPFREFRCAPGCVLNPDLLLYAPGIVRGTELALALSVVVWVGGASTRLMHTAPPRGRSAAPAQLLPIVVVLLWAGRLAQQPRPQPNDPYDRGVLVAWLAAIAGAAALHGRTAVGVAVARRRISRDARSLTHAASVETITGHLRHAVGDPGLHIRLGLDEASGPSATSVLRGGRVVASIDHRPAVRQRVAAVVTPAIALALETQLLLSEARAHVDELERSRARVVETTDAARRRLERDLHDGAQQRLLVVGMHLAHAADERPASDTWRTAVDHVADALAELRRIGRGDAAIIAELGLEDAVTALAGASAVAIQIRTTPCTSPDHARWTSTSATTAYRLVVASLADAETANAEAMAVDLRCLGEGRGHTLLTHHRGSAARDRSADHDRVVACGGCIMSDRDGVFEAWLP